MTSFQSSEASFNKATEKFKGFFGEDTIINLISYQEFYEGYDTRFSKDLSRSILENPFCLGVFIVPPENGIDNHVTKFISENINFAFGMGTGTLIKDSLSIGKKAYVYRAKNDSIFELSNDFDYEKSNNNYQYDYIRYSSDENVERVTKDDLIKQNLITMGMFYDTPEELYSPIEDDLETLTNLSNQNKQEHSIPKNLRSEVAKDEEVYRKELKAKLAEDPFMDIDVSEYKKVKQEVNNTTSPRYEERELQDKGLLRGLATTSKHVSIKVQALNRYRNNHSK